MLAARSILARATSVAAHASRTLSRSATDMSVTWFSEEWQEKLALPFDEFDVCVPDINDSKLHEIGMTNDIEHLSLGSFTSPAFPVKGWIHFLNLRFMVPLVCQREVPHAGETTAQGVFVWFLVDTGSLYTCLSKKSLESLFGEGNVTRSCYRLAIQDQTMIFQCHVSKAHFAEANILGADAMQRFKLSIVVDWKRNQFKLVQQ